MKYTIIIDKQPSTSPSEEKKEYAIDIEELRTYQGVSDTLKVTPDMAYVIRRLALSEYGVLSILDEPNQENLKDLNIELFEGTNYVYILNEQGNKISASYIIKSEFTDIYPTKVEMNSAITQSASSIEISVSQKLEGYSTTKEMNAAIKVSADSINSEVKKKVGEDEVISKINQSAEEIQIEANKISLEGKEINLTGDNINIKSNNFNVDKDGNLNCNNANMSDINIEGGSITLYDETNESAFRVFRKSNDSQHSYLANNRIGIRDDNTNYGINCSMAYSGSSQVVGAVINVSGNNGNTYIDGGEITCAKLNQTSLESIKKNISYYSENALETILNSDIYTYNLKTEKDTDKKHIGFVIGNNYKTPKEVMNNEGNAIELYSTIGIMWKAIQEQQKKIDELENKLKEVTNE